ncbi:hypothetical protein C2S51_018229 [Perilla frutescens var. frutescens]|nr:hypothetical protein C2S51_018229 [Perilla frutescens var. frutescens]
MTIDDSGKIEYLEGTMSAFDFIDTRKWTWKYLEGLCEQLGYLGSKKFYANDENDKLKQVICEHDTWMLILRAEKTREFTMYLEATKSITRMNGEEVEGEVVFLDEQDVDVTKQNVQPDLASDIGKMIVIQQITEDVAAPEIEDVTVSESEDSDYIYKEDSCEELIDDIIFKENVDQDVEWVGTKEVNNMGESSNTSDMEDDVSNESDFDSLSSDNGNEECSKGTERTSTSTSHNSQFLLGCDLKKSVKGFRNSAISELGVYISPYQAWRARQNALKLIEGDTTEQYSKLWDYAETLREKNPGSTVILQLDDTPTGKKFKRIYVCLAAVKNGFLSGYRPWIGVDGYHLRDSGNYPEYPASMLLVQYVREDKTGYIPPLPPNFARKKKGRPQKERRFDANEEPKKKKRHGSNLQKMAKQKFKVTCQFCGEEGHNRLGCQLRKKSEPGVEEERRQHEIVQETQPEIVEITQPEAEETTQPEVDVITQTDYPTLTQEDQDVEMMDSSKQFVSNVHSRSTNKPTTVLGRKMLARKRAELASKDPREYVSQEMSAPYSISNSIQATQPKQIGVQIRAPPPMSFHPQHFIGAPSGGVGAKKGKDGESMKVFTEGGQRFVTLSSLRAASHARRGEGAHVTGPSSTSNV